MKRRGEEQTNGDGTQPDLTAIQKHGSWKTDYEQGNWMLVVGLGVETQELGSL
jgi:hypothetical protein